MCKTCLRKVEFEGGVDWGPWGLRGTYTSAIQISSRLWASQNTSRDGEGSPESDEEILSDFPQLSCEGKKACATRSCGSPPERINVPSHAHRQVGADEGDVFGSNTCKNISHALVSDVTSSCTTLPKGSDFHSTVYSNEITKKASDREHLNFADSHGRKIVHASLSSGATGVGVVGSTGQQNKNGKLEHLKEQPKPFFYLPSEDDDDVSHEDQLLKDPDLYPVPKTHPGTPQTSSPLSSSSKNNTLSANSPQSPQKPQASKTQSEIQDRIRHCLQRARSRSSSLCGLGSFEAGLYRLEGLLEEKSTQENVGDESGSERLSKAVNTSRSPGHEVAPMPKYRTTGTITDVCTGENVAEVEIISLVQEQIPKYKLRADTITEFSGYDNADWGVTFPALKEEEVEALSPEQAEGALAYFGDNKNF